MKEDSEKKRETGQEVKRYFMNFFIKRYQKQIVLI